MKTVCTFLLSALFATVLAAQTAPQAAESPLKSEMAAFTVTVDPDEGELLVPASNIEPGDVIEYRIVYRNEADRPLRQIKAGALIPESTSYIDKSASEDGTPVLEFSIDGGETFAVPPIYYTRSNEDGSTERAVAAPEMYNRIRWTIPVLEPGAEKVLSYRVSVQ